MKKLDIHKFYHLINHGPCCLITSGNKNIKNIAPIAWITPLNDDPPLVVVCVASTHYTSELIEKYGEFVINVPSYSLLNVVIMTGKTSGKEEDKFKKFNILYEDGYKVNTVHLKNCVGFIEAKLFDVKEYSGVKLYVGEVVYCAVDENVYDKYLISHKAKTIHHIGGNNFFISPEIIKIK
ncbi:MAG: flavin reductase family protein [Elusimicrobiota bacterium]|nr:flavin reductase family protein [Endomicrobiia bacterium]MCX7910597.1 flavin reductase family protein [Endomicrobiia bacterium]MDW8164940.1 flavin reductase family protein [Elusimicrobiota bacterium]